MIRIRHLSQRRGQKWDFPDFSNKNRDLPNQVDILEKRSILARILICQACFKNNYDENFEKVESLSIESYS